LPPSSQAGGIPVLLAALQRAVAAARGGGAMAVAAGCSAAAAAPGCPSAVECAAAGLAQLLHLAANAAELPACRQELAGSGAAAALAREASALAAAAGEGDAAVALRTAAGHAVRLLGLKHWPQ
jgi:hypothetical protein